MHLDMFVLIYHLFLYRSESKGNNKKPAQDTPLIERMCSKDDVFAIVWNPDPSTSVGTCARLYNMTERVWGLIWKLPSR